MSPLVLLSEEKYNDKRDCLGPETLTGATRFFLKDFSLILLPSGFVFFLFKGFHTSGLGGVESEFECERCECVS